MLTCVYVFGGILLQKKCNTMMTFVYVFGGILCGLHKVHKTPRIPSIFENMGFKCLTCCELGFLAGGSLCVALNLILPCKFSQNLPTNDSL